MLQPPIPQDTAEFPPNFGPRFMVTVDTEEEFDWAKPIDRVSHGLKHVAQIARFQSFCEAHGVAPVYLVDWPIATSPEAAETLRGPVARGEAEIGVQLHPWVSPPFEEELTERNTFAGNLPPALEREKLLRLRDAIDSNFAATPLMYRAGRYGLGPATAGLLVDAGIAVDSSVRSKFDYSAGGGPDYRPHPLTPYWVDTNRRLLELPLTTVFSGLLRGFGDAIYPRQWRLPASRALMARLGLLERIPLTPEGVSVEEALRGVDVALEMGLPLLVFSFHSPSLDVGHTPYVQSAAELDALYDWWGRIFAELARRNVAPVGISGVLEAVIR
nr:polysaccharide deacetylase family protein [Altererythrobacter sp. B11]